MLDRSLAIIKALRPPWRPERPSARRGSGIVHGVAVDDGFAAVVALDLDGSLRGEGIVPLSDDAAKPAALAEALACAGGKPKRGASVLPAGASELFAYTFPARLSARERLANARYQVPAGSLRDLDPSDLHVTMDDGRPTIVGVCSAAALDAEVRQLAILGIRDPALFHFADAWTAALPEIDAVLVLGASAVMCSVNGERPAYCIWPRTDALDWVEQVTDWLKTLRGNNVADPRTLAAVGAVERDAPGLEDLERKAGVTISRASYGAHERSIAWWLAYGAARAFLVAT